jgi:pyruvate/2-oxoglutarate dehydrogenase complex dihydrolipoamide acyltransferase (E2) component
VREPIVMPGLSDMEAGTVIEWRKATVDAVERGEIVAVVDGDKVTLDVEAPASGILEIIAEEEAEVSVGQPIGWVGT